MPGFRASKEKDEVALMSGGEASGDCMLKPISVMLDLKKDT